MRGGAPERIYHDETEKLDNPKLTNIQIVKTGTTEELDTFIKERLSSIARGGYTLRRSNDNLAVTCNKNQSVDIIFNEIKQLAKDLLNNVDKTVEVSVSE